MPKSEGWLICAPDPSGSMVYWCWDGHWTPDREDDPGVRIYRSRQVAERAADRVHGLAVPVD
jgi:hypothetical protein